MSEARGLWGGWWPVRAGICVRVDPGATDSASGGRGGVAFGVALPTWSARLCVRPPDAEPSPRMPR